MIPIHLAASLDETTEAGAIPCVGCRNGKLFELQFDYAYQPIVDLSTRTIFAHEALVRGPQGQSAASVLAEINDSNRYQFDQACRVKAVAGAARLGMQERLSINFLPNAVYRPEVCIRTTLAAARQHNFPIDRIIFEVTEGEQVQDRPHLVNIFREYRRFGFNTAIDDFGAGYAGLNLLAEYQPDIVKIDMDLVRGIDQHRARQVIVLGIAAKLPSESFARAASWAFAFWLKVSKPGRNAIS